MAYGKQTLHKKHETLFTVEEVSNLYKVSKTFITKKAKEYGFIKDKYFGKSLYLLTRPQVETILRIPTVSDSVIYVNTIYEIYPSKMNYQEV